MSFPVVDLHCDLLAYLAMNPDRTPNDRIARCSLPQLEEGKVILQTLAIYAETGPYSLLCGLKQLELFQTFAKKKTPTRFLPAFESASAFSLENEPLDAVFARLDKILSQIDPLYISLTWNGENRYGGGTGANIGLKNDGKELLAYLSGKGVAIDLSHATDALSRGMLNEIDQKNLDLRILASHCNFRSIHDHERNLPDDVAKEVINRNGLIGLVFYSKFLDTPAQLVDQIEHGLELGGQNALAFGADFFHLDDFDEIADEGGFFPAMGDSSKYPSILQELEKIFSPMQLEKIASKNALAFLT